MLKPKSKQAPKPPKHLQPATKRWFLQVVESYELEEHHLRLLTLAGESWDRCVAAREIIDREGLTFVDRFGCPRARPEIAIERDSKIGFARLVRELDLDVEAPVSPGRPPLLRSNRRK
jgi:phage terminase small subunit